MRQGIVVQVLNPKLTLHSTFNNSFKKENNGMFLMMLGDVIIAKIQFFCMFFFSVTNLNRLLVVIRGGGCCLCCCFLLPTQGHPEGTVGLHVTVKRLAGDPDLYVSTRNRSLASGFGMVSLVLFKHSSPVGGV